MYLLGTRRPQLLSPRHQQLKASLCRAVAARRNHKIVKRVALCQSNRTGCLRIVFVSPEVCPWSKVGGLADVLAALPQALAARGHQVMTVAPYYSDYSDTLPTGVHVPLDLPLGVTLPLPDPPPLEHSSAEEQLEEERSLPKGHQSPGADLLVGKLGWRKNRGGSSKGRKSRRRGGELAVAGDPCAGAVTGKGSVASRGASGAGNHETRVQRQRAQQQAAGVKLPRQPAPAPRHAQYHLCRQGGVDRVFVDHPLFQQTGIYGSGVGAGVYTYTHPDSHHHPLVELQFNVLCQAALAAPLLLWDDSTPAGTARPGGPSQEHPLVFCANDWPTALLPLRLHHVLRAAGTQGAPTPAPGEGGPPSGAQAAGGGGVEAQRAVQELYRRLGPYLRTATAAYCIHNLAFQGAMPASAFASLSLPAAALPGMCSGGDWRGALEVIEEQRREWREKGWYSRDPPPGSGVGAEQAEVGGDVEQAGRRQRRWRWKRKLRQQPDPAPASASLAAAAAQAAAVAAAGRRPPSCSLLTKADPLPLGTAPSSDSLAAPSKPGSERAAAQLARGGLPLAGRQGGASTACASGVLNLKQGALLTSDGLVTVSPGYAAEVQQDEGMGCGVREVIGARGITGIMNGIDTTEWDPSVDPRLPPPSGTHPTPPAAARRTPRPSCSGSWACG